MSRRLRVRDKFTFEEEREIELPIKFGYLEFRNRVAAGDPALQAKATRTSLEHLFQQIPAIVRYQDAFAVENQPDRHSLLDNPARGQSRGNPRRVDGASRARNARSSAVPRQNCRRPQTIKHRTRQTRTIRKPRAARASTASAHSCARRALPRKLKPKNTVTAVPRTTTRADNYTPRTGDRRRALCPNPITPVRRERDSSEPISLFSARRSRAADSAPAPRAASSDPRSNSRSLPP